MALRSMWKGSLGFGMVAIPVKLYGATDDNRISLNQLHKECGSRIKMPKFCPKCERNVDTGEIIRAYPIDKEHYVPLSEGELESLPLNSVKSIQVDAFFKGELDDPRWYDEPYFLSPEEVGTKAFVLFVKAMEEAGVLGVAKIAIREKEHLALVRPFGGLLILQTLHWGDELRDYGELIPSATVTEKEMEMAGRLIAAMTGEVDLHKYKDEYRAALAELISAKLEGKTITVAPRKEKQAVDLAEALLASLNAVEAK